MERNRGLTPKQAAFVKWYVSKDCYGNGTESAKRAGYCGTENALGVMANKLLRKGKIKAEVDKGMEKATKAANVTVETVLKNLVEVYNASFNDQEFSSALRALELQGKFLKMWVERIEINDISTLPEGEIDDLLLEFANDESIDLSRIIEAVTTETSITLSAPGKETTH